MKKNSNRLFLNFVLCFIGFSIPMGVFLSLIYMSLLKGMILGFVGGFFFAAMIVAFIVIVAARKDKLKERYGIEDIAFYDGGASYILNNKENIGGWMYLFEDRLCFLAHGINITTGAIIIPYKDMLEVTPGSRARRIAVTTNDGNTGEFLVNESKEWLEILQSKITT